LFVFGSMKLGDLWRRAAAFARPRASTRHDALAPGFPFTLREIATPDARVHALFQRAFGSPAPAEPRHFVALRRREDTEEVAGYIHFTAYEPGIFLCGGLCVDARLYRRLTTAQRGTVAAQGSLSRWLSDGSIAALGAKHAVFAFTGDRRSQRDAAALGFVPSGRPFLYVQWHDAPEALRADLLERVARLGPF
jgi:hypothetical protein